MVLLFGPRCIIGKQLSQSRNLLSQLRVVSHGRKLGIITYDPDLRPCAELPPNRQTPVFPITYVFSRPHDTCRLAFMFCSVRILGCPAIVPRSFLLVCYLFDTHALPDIRVEMRLYWEFSWVPWVPWDSHGNGNR